MKNDQMIFLVAQKDLADNDPTGDQIYRVGVVAKIKQVIRRSDEGIRLFAEGLYRAEIVSVVKDRPVSRDRSAPRRHKAVPPNAPCGSTGALHGKPF